VRRLRRTQSRGGQLGAHRELHLTRLHPDQHAEGCRRSRRHCAPPRPSGPAPGKLARGWLGPGLTETWDTPDLLAAQGYDYVYDWALDDEPVVLKTTSSPILNVPYTQK